MPNPVPAKNSASQNPYDVLRNVPQNYGMDRPLNAARKPKAEPKKELQAPITNAEPKADWVDIKKPPSHKKEAENGQSWLQRLLPSFLSR